MIFENSIDNISFIVGLLGLILIMVSYTFKGTSNVRKSSRVTIEEAIKKAGSYCSIEGKLMPQDNEYILSKNTQSQTVRYTSKIVRKRGKRKTGNSKKKKLFTKKKKKKKIKKKKKS